MRQGMTIADAAQEWVREMDAIQQSMIKKLMEFDIDDWHELTKPHDTDRVYVYELPDETPDGEPYEGTLMLVYKCGQKKLNNLYYQMKEQRR